MSSTIIKMLHCSFLDFHIIYPENQLKLKIIKDSAVIFYSTLIFCCDLNLKSVK